MTLKHRIPLNLSILFSGLLAIVMLMVYFLFADFRKQEFRDRLAEKSENTVKLLLEVKEIDEQILKAIDRNSINNLYNEKTLIFNENKKLIYSSIDDTKVNWTIQELDEIKKKGSIFKAYKEYETLGLYFRFQGKDYYSLISAEDTYGQSKLDFLKIVLAISFVMGLILAWTLSFTLSKKILSPLDILRKQIRDITTHNLSALVTVPKEEDEIQALSETFNEMLQRIDKAYTSQKNFTSNASHELRTPIARIVTQIENLLNENELPGHFKQTLSNISQDAYQMSDTISSLFLLTTMEEKKSHGVFNKVRIDEIIFNAVEKTSALFPDLKFQFEINSDDGSNSLMEIQGNETLLGIAFQNLLKNAYLYSDDRIIKCEIREDAETLTVTISNHGANPGEKETQWLFQPFKRGPNALNTPGSGMGLNIVQRIIQYHDAMVRFKIPAENMNELVVQFTKS